MEVMLGKEFQRCTRTLRWVKRTANIGNNIRKEPDAGVESTANVGDSTVGQFV